MISANGIIGMMLFNVEQCIGGILSASGIIELVIVVEFMALVA